MRYALVLVLVFSLFPTRALAQEIPCEAGPCLQRVPRRQPTHFIAELNGGSSTYGSGGLALGLVLGVGGKLRGFPPIFYLFGELSYNTAAESSSIALSNSSLRDDRAFRDLAVGLRIYLPIWGPIRLFGDAGVGGSYVTANVERAGLPMVSADGWMPIFQLGGGLQVRLFHHLSVGMRFKAVLGRDASVGALHELVGDALPLRHMATANLTWHF
jgi:hypothetical protein